MQLRPNSRRFSLAEVLFGWRRAFGFGWAEWSVLIGYLSLVCSTVRYHEPSADEAQAWLLARDNSIWQLLRYRLHYEGHPGLWHVLLHVLQRFGTPYGALGWIGAACATVGIIVFLRWSPFPLIVRVLLPFTFFFAYQYAVVARPYTMFPALAFGLCVLFPQPRRVGWFALLAGLLANISLQGAVASFMLVGLYAWEHLRRRSEKTVRLQWKTPGALYAFLLTIAALSAVPASDTGIAGGPPVVSGGVAAMLLHFPGPLPASEKLPEPPEEVRRAGEHLLPSPPPELAPLPAKASFLHHPGAWVNWYLRHDEYDTEGHTHPHTTSQDLLKVVVEVLSLITAPLSTSKLLALLFLGTLVGWLWTRGCLRMLLPWAANIAVGEALWVADHHLGLLMTMLVAALWLGFERSGGASMLRRSAPVWLERLLLISLLLVCAGQLAWTAVSVRSDRDRNYDPSAETAAFLQQQAGVPMAAFGFNSTGVQPYYRENPFFNLRHSYWVWSTAEDPNGAHATTIAQQPKIVLLAQDLLASGFTHNDWAPLSLLTSVSEQRDLARNTIVLDLEQNGYRETHRFCGDRFFRFKASYRACNHIFERVAEPLSRTTRVPERESEHP